MGDLDQSGPHQSGPRQSRQRQPWLHELVTVLSAPTVVLSERSGQLRAVGAQGVVHADARVLSTAVLSVGGAEPDPLSSGLLSAIQTSAVQTSAVQTSAVQFSAVQTSAGAPAPGADSASRALFFGAARELGDDIADPTVLVERERAVMPGRVRERIRLVSASRSPVVTEATLRVAADLAGIGEIKAGQAGEPVQIRVADPGSADAAILTWGSGPLAVRLTAPGATASASAGGALLRWPVALATGGEQEIGWELTVADPAAVVAAAPDPPEGVPAWAAVSAHGDDPRLPRLLARAVPDAVALRLVTARNPADVFLAGGAPWYLTLFGRDSIWAARLMLPFGWQLAASTLRTLAALQGRRVDTATGEAPGKIPHELRTAGRQAGGGLPPLYYGTVDATPLWVCLLHDAWRWGMPPAQVRDLLPSLTAALAWMRDYADADGDGLLEYLDESGSGLANQGWKDSGDAIRFADGRIAAPPVALCEVQGYAYEAASRGADLLAAFGEPGAGEWRARAGQLAAAFRAAFWIQDGAGSYPALALDAARRQVDSLTSNIGHLLGTGLLTPPEERLVAARLSGPEMSSGYGLRTMSAKNGGYSPLSYHCGSVWSHDTAIVIRGLAASGHAEQAAALADGLLDAAAGFGWRLPELFSGEARARVPWPSPYPASCSPQAWSAAAVGALVVALLGLSADVPGGADGDGGAGGDSGADGDGGADGAGGTAGVRGVRIAPPPRRAGGAGASLHVDGLVAGNQVFSAGVDPGGAGYLRPGGRLS